MTDPWAGAIAREADVVAELDRLFSIHGDSPQRRVRIADAGVLLDLLHRERALHAKTRRQLADTQAKLDAHHTPEEIRRLDLFRQQ